MVKLPEPPTPDQLRQRRDKLANRLEDGYLKINEIGPNDPRVPAWESFWLSLLLEYEMVCEELEGAS